MQAGNAIFGFSAPTIIATLQPVNKPTLFTEANPCDSSATTPTPNQPILPNGLRKLKRPYPSPKPSPTKSAPSHTALETLPAPTDAATIVKHFKGTRRDRIEAILESLSSFYEALEISGKRSGSSSDSTSRSTSNSFQKRWCPCSNSTLKI